jgi:trk system potassium uptake protein TrkH
LRPLRDNAEAKTFLGIFVGGSLFLLLFLSAADPGPMAGNVRAAVFQTASILTTTGYSTADFGAWPNPAQILLLLLMIAGGCSGSTAGGIKVFRVVVGLRAVVRQLEHAFRPHVVRPIRINGRTLADAELRDITAFLVLGGFVLLASVLLVSVLEPELAPLDVFSATVACLFNVGPGLGAVGPTETYAFFGDAAKVHLALLMIMGRLEFFAVLVLLAPSLWKRFS